jgi:hypothetical protein
MMGKTTLHIHMGRRGLRDRAAAQQISTTAKPKLRKRLGLGS